MVSIETAYSSSITSGLNISEKSPRDTRKLSHPNLLKSHIILLSLIFTILQNLSLSKLTNAKPIVLVVSLVAVFLLFVYLIHKVPLSTDLFVKKIRLVLRVLKSSTDNLKFDVCVMVICILLFGWIISIWKSFLSVVLWAVVIWIYNLTENTISAPEDTPILLNSASIFGDSKYSTNSANTNLESSALRYINILEKKIEDLTKRIDELEDCKIQQSILIYTYNHKLTEKLDNLEKSLQEKNSQLYKNFVTIQGTVEALTHRKRARFAIMKMYVKQLLLFLLPNPVIFTLRLKKRLILAVWRKLQSVLHQFES